MDNQLFAALACSSRNKRIKLACAAEAERMLYTAALLDIWRTQLLGPARKLSHPLQLLQNLARIKRSGEPEYLLRKR